MRHSKIIFLKMKSYKMTIDLYPEIKFQKVRISFRNVKKVRNGENMS